MHKQPIVQFLLPFLVIFGLLVVPWPGWEEGYAGLFRAAGQWGFGRMGPRAMVRFLPNSEKGTSTQDTKVYLANRELVGPDGMGPVADFTFSTRYIGYLPSVMLLALIVSTPIPWKRRAWALLGGMVLFHGYLALIVVILIVDQCNASPVLSLFILPPFSRSLLRALYEIFVTYLGARFAVVVLIWILVSFRRDDWIKILSPVRPKPE